ncbi:MAG: VWA domain-containing protein [Rhizobiales bacterium TMED94]|nr:VWA containing CoxE family protein [Rhodobiaceae bacterium]RPF88171.1 MAG: VWA domain-containing protein [Rhizobiales bacterium TMED94]
MVDFLRDFIHILRSSDLRVSTSESIDAMNVVSEVGLDDKSLLKDSLSFSLAKTLREKEIFNKCFDNFFEENYMNLKGEKLSQENHEEDIEFDELNNIENTEKNLEELYKSSDKTSLMTVMALAARDANLQDIKLFTQVGMFTRKIFDEMGLEKLNNDIFQAAREGDGKREGELKNIRENLRLEIRDYVENQVKLRTTNAGKQLREDALSQMRLMQADKSDYQIMSGIIKKMARRLISVHSRRKRKSQRGVLDIRSTIRANQEYDGILFETVWKKTKVDRPKIVALCDVSGSVANVSRFFLMFLHSLTEILPNVRTFAFSNKAGEVTDLFENKDIEVAAAETLLLNGGGSTDYGQAFVDLEGFLENNIDRKTTVIILGDARSNYGDPRCDVLKTIQEKSKRILFLNPEPKSVWGTGDSEMLRFVPYCSKSKVCSSLFDLERVVDDMLRSSI